jgi:hypothetical protein
MANEVRTQVGWRIPLKLHREIQRLAETEHRTINAEAIQLLYEAVAARKGSRLLK